MVLSPADPVESARGFVVITGADGFAGRAACARFRAMGVPFRGLVRALSAATAARPDMLPVGDLTVISNDALANALRGAHAVVHLAGRAHVMRETAADPLAAFHAINVSATERLARASAAAGTAHFVFASTVKVNGEASPPERPFRESDPPDPRDDYAVSKWKAECALADVARETGMPVTVLRLPLLYGPGVKGNVALLTDTIASGMPLPLGSINNRRSLLGAGNFASALDAVLCHPAPTPHTVATYFVADERPVATPELVRAIAEALGVTARLLPIPPSLLRWACACVGKASASDRLTGSLVVDTGAFRDAFGWQPPRSMAEELADMASARREAAASPL
jgi:nucleoside-diphosphate-sugar epimerase